MSTDPQRSRGNRELRDVWYRTILETTQCSTSSQPAKLLPILIPCRRTLPTTPRGGLTSETHQTSDLRFVEFSGYHGGRWQNHIATLLAEMWANKTGRPRKARNAARKTPSKQIKANGAKERVPTNNPGLIWLGRPAATEERSRQPIRHPITGAMRIRRIGKNPNMTFVAG